MLTFLYGAETYQSAKKIKEIKENFQAKDDPTGLNILTLEGKDCTLEKLNSAISQGGFLVSKKLVIIKNLISNKAGKEIIEFVVEKMLVLKKSDNHFVFWEQGEADRRTKIFKSLNSDKKTAQEFKPLEYAELGRWLNDYLNKNQAKMESGAQKLLLSFVGNNLWQLANELDKLIAFVGGQPITEDNVNELVGAKSIENIFGLTDALSQNNKKQALKLLTEQLAAGLNAQYILSMIIRQFRIIAQLKSLTGKNMSEREMVAETNLHPFVVKKTLPIARKFSPQQITATYGEMRELEKKFKSSKISAETLIQRFIIKI